jgi:hypothetical protein
LSTLRIEQVCQAWLEQQDEKLIKKLAFLFASCNEILVRVAHVFLYNFIHFMYHMSYTHVYVYFVLLDFLLPRLSHFLQGVFALRGKASNACSQPGQLTAASVVWVWDDLQIVQPSKQLDIFWIRIFRLLEITRYAFLSPLTISPPPPFPPAALSLRPLLISPLLSSGQLHSKR